MLPQMCECRANCRASPAQEALRLDYLSPENQQNVVRCGRERHVHVQAEPCSMGAQLRGSRNGTSNSTQLANGIESQAIRSSPNDYQSVTPMCLRNTRRDQTHRRQSANVQERHAVQCEQCLHKAYACGGCGSARARPQRQEPQKGSRGGQSAATGSCAMGTAPSCSQGAYRRA
jgi:hypothetical protein